MINITEDNKTNYKLNITSDDRQFLLKAIIGTEEELAVMDTLTAEEKENLIYKEDIISMTLEEYAEAQDYLSMGNFCSSKLTLTFFDRKEGRADYDDYVIQAYCGVCITEEPTDTYLEEDYEMIPLGTFHIMDVVKSDGNLGRVTLTAYDRACMLEDIFEPTEKQLLTFSGESTLSLSVKLIINYIAAQKGLTLANDSLPDIALDTLLTGITYRQMLGYMAGLMGCNARFNREDQLEFYWYQEADCIITPDLQYYGEFVMNRDSQKTITVLTCDCNGRKMTEKSSDPGDILQMENPLMTDVRLKTIYNERIGLMGFDTTYEDTGVFTTHLTYSGAEVGDVLYGTYDGYLECFILDEASVDGYDLSLYSDAIYLIVSDSTSTMNGKHVYMNGVNEGRIDVRFSCTPVDDAEGMTFKNGQNIGIVRIKQWVKNTTSGINFADVEEVKLITDPSDKNNALNGLVIYLNSFSLPEYIMKRDIDGVPVIGTAGQKIMCARKIQMTYLNTYLPSQLKWRGNPAVEPGDIIYVKRGNNTYRLYVMEQILQMGSGMYSKIVCKSEKTVV